MRRLLAAGAIAAVGVLAAAAITSAAPAPSTAQVQVRFQIQKFVKQGKGLVAHGTAVATYSDSSGQTKTVTAPLTAHVLTRLKLRGLQSAAETCQVLNLRLDKLSLALLGLHVDLDKVVLTVTANSNGGALGSLFCDLAHTKVKVLQSTAKRLTQSARASGLATTGLGFSVPLRGGATTATGTCPVLDLVLGPLDLQLLGLNATLNQVHLSITADASGGVLGSLFCQLATATATLPAVP
jgi:hypothetical protein